MLVPNNLVGWVWLVRTPRQIEITSTPNQDSPMTSGSFQLWAMMSGNTLLSQVPEQTR